MEAFRSSTLSFDADVPLLSDTGFVSVVAPVLVDEHDVAIRAREASKVRKKFFMLVVFVVGELRNIFVLNESGFEKVLFYRQHIFQCGCMRLL